MFSMKETKKRKNLDGTSRSVPCGWAANVGAARSSLREILHKNFRVGTLNVGSLRGRSGEVVEMSSAEICGGHA